MDWVTYPILRFKDSPRVTLINVHPGKYTTIVPGSFEGIDVSDVVILSTSRPFIDGLQGTRIGRWDVVSVEPGSQRIGKWNLKVVACSRGCFEDPVLRALRKRE